MEVKRTDQEWEEVTRQLCTYLHIILKEQLDRRFVIGLILSGAELLVWQNDRAGLFGTQTAFNIHEVCYIHSALNRTELMVLHEETQAVYSGYRCFQSS